MTVKNDADAVVARYFRRLKWGLSTLVEADQREIVRELESHLVDRLGASPSVEDVEDELARLGPPEEYARGFVESFDLSSAIASGSPVLMLRHALRLTGHGVMTMLSAAGLLVLFAISLSLMALAPLKLIFPQHVGLWLPVDGAYPAIGFLARPPAGATELLAYWIIPLAIVLGLLLLQLATLFLRKFLLSRQETTISGGGRL